MPSKADTHRTVLKSTVLFQVCEEVRRADKKNQGKGEEDFLAMVHKDTIALSGFLGKFEMHLCGGIHHSANNIMAICDKKGPYDKLLLEYIDPNKPHYRDSCRQYATNVKNLRTHYAAKLADHFDEAIGEVVLFEESKHS